MTISIKLTKKETKRFSKNLTEANDFLLDAFVSLYLGLKDNPDNVLGKEAAKEAPGEAIK